MLLAAIITLGGSPSRTLPASTRADDRIDDRIEGVLGGPLVRTKHGIGAPLHADETTVWVWSDARAAGERAIEPGLRVVVTGRLRTPRGSLSPGESDRAALVASRGAAWELTARHIEVLAEDGAATSRVWRWADRVQRVWVARVRGDEHEHGRDDAHDAANAALCGIVTGDRADVPESLDERWRATGIYHVLSVSGLHLAAVSGLAFLLLTLIVAASPWGSRVHPARCAAPIALVLACAYTLITGAQLATLRALVVVAITLVAVMLDRPIRLVDALGVAAIVLLLWRPQDLYDPSFQLSFVAALTLALRPRDTVVNDSRVVRWIARGVVTSAWVAITTAPITAYHFQQVAIGGVVGNLVLTPLLELVALPIGLAGVVLGDLGAPLVSAAVWIVRAVDEVAKLLALGTPTGTIALGSPLAMAALVAIGVALGARRRRTRVDVIAWIALCMVWSLGRTPPQLGALRVTFLDVGQGDAALVELPNGAVWLVDAGGHASARDITAASAPGRTIARTLGVYGHRAIDLAIVSHPHPDHYLGLVALAGTIPIRELWFADTTPAFAGLADRLAAHGTRLAQPPLGTLRDGAIELDVIAPRYESTPGARPTLAADPVRSVNDNSLVVAIRYAGRTVLFTGDLELEGEDLLVAAGIGPVDVVKVAHHGSRTSSARGFVEATRPAVAVISCGLANPYGFPDPGVVERWRAVGTRVERTDVGGAITLTISADGSLAVLRHAEP